MGRSPEPREVSSDLTTLFKDKDEEGLSLIGLEEAPTDESRRLYLTNFLFQEILAVLHEAVVKLLLKKGPKL